MYVNDLNVIVNKNRKHLCCCEMLGDIKDTLIKRILGSQSMTRYKSGSPQISWKEKEEKKEESEEVRKEHERRGRRRNKTKLVTLT